MTPPRKDLRQEPQACVQCYKAKTQCSWASGLDGTCSRCARLKKQCKPRGYGNHALATPPTRSPGIVSEPRIAELEGRVDMLTNALYSSSSRHLHAQGRATSSHSAGEATSLSGRNLSGSDRNSDSSFLSNISNDQAARQICLYQDKILPYFPFVLPPALSIEDFRAQSPLLFRAMLTASLITNRDLQAVLGAQLTGTLSHAAFVQGEKSLDLLQALLVHISTYHTHLTERSQISNLMQLTLAILADLGLDKISHENDRRTLIFDDSRTSYGFNSTSASPLGNFAEYRCVLGAFYLSSIVSVTFQRIDPFGFTPRLQCICDILSQSRIGTDVTIAMMVKVQALVNNISEALPIRGMVSSAKPSFWNVPVTMHLDAFQDAIDAANAGFPSQADHLRMHFTVASIYLREVALYSEFWRSDHDSRRLDACYRCLHTVVRWISDFMELPNEDLSLRPYTLWAQLAYTLLICSRLSLLRFPGWTLETVENVIDFSATLDRMHRKLMEASQPKESWGDDLPASDETDKVLARTATKIDRVRNWFAQQIAQETMDKGPPVSRDGANGWMSMGVEGNTGMPASTYGPESGQNDVHMDSLAIDESFWNDIF